MPLAAQALLPFLALLGAAVIVQRRPRRASNGWISVAATGLAGITAMVELVRLAPGEHVDVPYLTTFPYADLAIRLDGLSLAFASVTLITAALLMLARLRLHGDRRDPWLGWLLTAAATCAVIFAHNLLLVYIALQLLTLAWTGALDETARRRRGLRLSVQVAEIALLERSAARRVALLLVAHAALALALSTGADPLMTVACTWLWLLLVPLAGLASVRVAAGSLPEAFTQVNLAMIPGSTAFVGLWLGSLALNARGLLFGIIPVGVGVALSATAALSRLKRPRSLQLDPPTVWAAGLLLIAAFPIVVMGRLVVPAAATVRLVPGGTVAASPFGIVAGGRFFPALVVSLVMALVLGLAIWRLRMKAPTLPFPKGGGKIQAPNLPALPRVPPWGRFVLWGAFAVAVYNVLTRP